MMIRVDSLRYAVGDFNLDVSLEIADAEYFVLLGSTGSGKTLFLECLCGLHELCQGSVLMDGKDLTAVEPGARSIGYVPQDGALFDHLSVRQNIEFGLKVRGEPKTERTRAANRLASMLGIERLLPRRIPGLSGGERQRVALARALASEPSVLLLDEPVSALDEFTRDSVCRQLRTLQRSTRVSTIHVCHSFEEARLVADRIGVIGGGRIVQTGTPDDLMSRPANRYVANLLRLENVFSGRAVPTAEGSRIEAGGLSFSAPPADGEIEFFIRPWDITIAGRPHGTLNSVEGNVIEYSCAGPLARLRIDGPLPLVTLLARDSVAAAQPAEGKRVQLIFPPTAVHIFSLADAQVSNPRRDK